MSTKLQQSFAAFGGRILFIVFLVASLVMVAIYFREDTQGPLHSMQNTVSGLTVPFKFVGSAVGSGTEAVGTAAENASASGETLESLREQNQQLIDEIVKLEEYRQKSEEYAALLELKNTYNLDTVAAHVVGRSSNSWQQVITIDRGSNDGIVTGLPVVGTSGVIGQVIAVSSNSCDVRLLEDPQSGVSVLIQSSRVEGVVTGSVEGVLYLEYIDADAVVQVGDVLITSGLGGSFTRGLTVGIVVKIEENQGGATRKIVVAPNDSVGSLEEVLVVVGMASEGATVQYTDIDATSNADQGNSNNEGDAG